MKLFISLHPSPDFSFYILYLLMYMFYYQKIFTIVPLAQCHGESFTPQPSAPPQRGRVLQLSDHVAGVCRGSRLLEGSVAPALHRTALAGHRLLRQRSFTF